MKLRNLLVASLAACTLASCSKDSVIDEGPKGPVDAVFSFSAASKTMTKAADPNKLNNEEIVKRLTAFVYDATGKNIATKDSTWTADPARPNELSSISELRRIIVKVTPDADLTKPTTDNFSMLLVANASDEMVSSIRNKSLEDAKNVATDVISSYQSPADVAAGRKYLPMASDAIAFTGLVPIGESNTENWVSQDKSVTSPDAATAIQLTRLVARVQLKELKSNFVGTYAGATFKLTRLSLVNVRSTSMLVNKINASDYLRGYRSAFNVAEGPVQKWIDPTSEVDPSLTKEYEGGILIDGSGIDFTDSQYKAKMFQCYAFENQVKGESTGVYETALLITGIFTRPNAQTGEEKQFRVVLADKDKGTAPEVLRNTIYNLTVTISGEGSDNEDNILSNAYISFKIDVAPWTVIDQNEDDVN